MLIIVLRAVLLLAMSIIEALLGDSWFEVGLILVVFVLGCIWLILAEERCRMV